jgi:GNAT superfamily N-acetyltransferase
MDMTHDHSDITIRTATIADADSFLLLVDALADYEMLPRPSTEARQRLLRDGFGPAPRFEAALACVGGRPVAYAIIYETYSSFLALPTLYLEDIFVLPEFRKQGAGLALFLHCARIARDRGCGRMDWTVLHWNDLAKSFYRRLGAEHLDEWQLFRLTREQIDALPFPPP